VGKLTVEDYQQLEPEIRALVAEYNDDVRLLLDMEEFAGKEVKAWLREDD